MKVTKYIFSVTFLALATSALATPYSNSYLVPLSFIPEKLSNVESVVGNFSLSRDDTSPYEIWRFNLVTGLDSYGQNKTFVALSSLDGWGEEVVYGCDPSSFYLKATTTADHVSLKCENARLESGGDYSIGSMQFNKPLPPFSILYFDVSGGSGSLISAGGKLAINSFKRAIKNGSGLLDLYESYTSPAVLTSGNNILSIYEEYAGVSLPMASIDKNLGYISSTSSTSFNFRYDAPHDTSVYEVTAIAKHSSGFEQVLMSTSSAVTAEVTKTLTIPSTFPTGDFYIDFTIRSRKDGKIYQRRAYGFK